MPFVPEITHLVVRHLHDVCSATVTGDKNESTYPTPQKDYKKKLQSQSVQGKTAKASSQSSPVKYQSIHSQQPQFSSVIKDPHC